jgi:Zn-dependent protease with chaperone function
VGTGREPEIELGYPMKNLLRYAMAALIIMVIAAASFFIGAKSARKEPTLSDEMLAEVQANIAVNHLIRFREIEADLVGGCTDVALEKTRVFADSEMRLLASFFKEHKSASVSKYAMEQQPHLLKEIEAYKSKYGDSFTLRQCTKPQRQ